MTDTSRIYLLTTDSKWYYYDGTQWTAGGNYNMTAIADGSIDFLKFDTTLQDTFDLDFAEKIPIPNDTALSLFFAANTLNVLLNKTNFDLSKHADSVFELANSIFEPILAHDNVFDNFVIKGILTLLYSNHFVQ